MPLAAWAICLLSWADRIDGRGPTSRGVGVNYAMWPLFVSMAALLLTYRFTDVRRIAQG